MSEMSVIGEVVKVSGGVSTVSDLLRDAMISQEFADVTLCCTGGRRFFAHRLVLSAASSYLQKVLSAHGTSGSQCEPITVILADVEGNDLAAILGFVYTGSTAVSEERLEAFSSTAEALKIKIPPLPRPLTLSYNEHHLMKDEYKCRKKYYEDCLPDDNFGINMTARQSPRQYDEEAGDCLNLEKKSIRSITERRQRFYVANRVSASPWCQMLRPHHLPRIQPIILKNNVTHSLESSEDTSVRLARYEEIPTTTELQAHIPENSTECISHVTSDTDSIQPPVVVEEPTSFVVSLSTPTQGAVVYREFINEPLVEVSPSESLIKLPSEPTHTSSVGKINVPIEYSEAERDSQSDINDNNNTTEAGCNKDQHKCNVCDKTFVSRASLKVHGRTHSGEKPFRCKDCGKEFSQLRNYKYHRSIHEGTGEFSATCPECGKVFNDRGYLGSHMKIHRNRKEYACQECGKSFNQRVAYNMHVRIHTGIKPHRCDECGKSFSRKMLLKQHMRTHSGERPYECHICHKAFADRSNMTLHTRLHSGLKPYQCEICSKAFTKKHHLKTHLNYHTGVKPYSCPNCSLSFSQSSNMRTHLKKCLINNKSVKIHDDDKTYVNNTQIAGFSAALTPPYSDLEPSSNAMVQDTVR